jgi:hypothetical protein
MKDSKKDSESSYVVNSASDMLVGIMTVILVILSMLMLSAFVLGTLWGWFLVPLGLPAISYVHAYGLSIVVTYLQGVKDRNNNTTAKELLVSSVSLSVGALIFGYAATLLM